MNINHFEALSDDLAFPSEENDNGWDDDIQFGDELESEKLTQIQQNQPSNSSVCSLMTHNPKIMTSSHLTSALTSLGSLASSNL
jgi:hypothetical protein